ncbi:MAG: VanZ family protein [Lachnospiraceae bacterium]|nr:VanZ family protein [Lachnospiraceae bacterium]MDY5497320.1 VanZ family protein [Anaerobutyricum sp.]
MNKQRKKLGLFSLLLLIVYFCVVVYFFFFSDRLGRSQGYSTYRYNLVLFAEIRRFIIYRNRVSLEAFLLNLVGNLLVFFPVGFLIPILRLKKTGCIRIMIYSFLFSLCIETLQLVTRVGVFDVDDLLMNTAGGLIGWSCCQLSWFVYHKFMAYQEKRKKGKGSA